MTEDPHEMMHKCRPRLNVCRYFLKTKKPWPRSAGVGWLCTRFQQHTGKFDTYFTRVGWLSTTRKIWRLTRLNGYTQKFHACFTSVDWHHTKRGISKWEHFSHKCRVEMKSRYTFSKGCTQQISEISTDLSNLCVRRCSAWGYVQPTRATIPSLNTGIGIQ